jgi:glycosyltransferase involved in cell wall biosynthesis
MSVNIAVNGRFEGRRVTGVERYASEILRCLAAQVRVVKPRHRLWGLRGHMWEQLLLPFLVSKKEVLWSPANTGPLVLANQVATIQDLSPLEHPEWFRADFAAWYRLFLPILAKRVRQVVVPSQYVRRRIEARFGVKNITVTSAGVDGTFFHPHAVQNKYELPEKYILFVGSLEPRKNLPVLLRAWNMISKDHANTWLIIAGVAGQVFKHVGLPSDTDRTRFLGYIPEADLPGLYAAATLFVLPSLDEGFGLPVLEAMSCGTPVISSNSGALPEIVGDAAVLINPLHVDEIGEAMRALLSSRDLRYELRQKGLEQVRAFTWERSAERIWDVLSHEA